MRLTRMARRGGAGPGPGPGWGGVGLVGHRRVGNAALGDGAPAIRTQSLSWPMSGSDFGE